MCNIRASYMKIYTTFVVFVGMPQVFYNKKFKIIWHRRVSNVSKITVKFFHEFLMAYHLMSVCVCVIIGLFISNCRQLTD